MEKNNKKTSIIVKGTDINILQLNVRGQIIPIYSSSLIFEFSERLKSELKKPINQFPIYLDVNPDSFHSILSYFKVLFDITNHPNQINEEIRNLFIDSYINNPEILSTFVYLEMPSSFISRFIRIQN